MGKVILFLQTTDTAQYQYGLLNEKDASIEFVEIHKTTKDENLFLQLDDLLKSKNIDFKKDISEMLVCAGPGSYTGMRVGEGISAIAELIGVKVLNYYQFEIPELMGPSEGIWLCRAFKGEYFVHEWSKENISEDYLINQKQFELLIQKNEKPKFFFGYVTENQEQFKNCTTMNIQMLQSKSIVSLLYKNARRKPLMYFRTPENEFKVN